MRYLSLIVLLGLLAACTSSPRVPGIITPVKPEPLTARYVAADWSALPDWPGEQLNASWAAWLNSCKRLGARPGWQAVCAEAQALTPVDADSAQAFFERHFSPWQITSSTGAEDGLITGYYEALLKGGLTPGPGRVPIYAVPDDLLTLDIASLYPEVNGLRLRGRLQGKTVKPYWSRADIDQGKAPVDDKVLAWADDAIDAFFLQIQGSGRIELEDGTRLRLAYAEQNGHPYKSIGKWLVDNGEMTLEQTSMKSIREWGKIHPERLQEMLEANPSYVFFRLVPDSTEGAIGALNVPLTDGASIAVDPKFTPLGTPVYLSTTRPDSKGAMNRLVHAQDAGGAIRGPVRADFFWGFGKEPGALAGAMKQRGKMWLLWPKGLALPESR